MSWRFTRRPVRLRLKCVVALAAAMSMLVFLVEYRYLFGLTYAQSGWFVGVDSGEFILGHDPTCPAGLVESGREPYYWHPGLATWLLSAPLWPLEAAFFPLAAAAAWLFWKEMRYQLPGLCHKCGYDMTGLTEGPCPECGGRHAG